MYLSWVYRPLLGAEPESESLETIEIPDPFEEDGDVVSEDDEMLCEDDEMLGEDDEMLGEDDDNES